MLSLQSETSPRWLDQVSNSLDELLIDHAHCEKKAAGTAMNLMFAYVDRVPLIRGLSEIVEEELAHFILVLNLLERRGIPFRRMRPSRYGARLAELANKQEPRRAVDRLLIAGLIEARSCERFDKLRRHLSDPELCRFFGDLFESEARHHATYVKLALQFEDEKSVWWRLNELASAEAQIIEEGDAFPRMHS